MDVSISTILTNVFTFNSMIAIFIGIIGGIVIGSLPGLTANMGVALLVPVTFGMETSAGLLMLVALYTSAIYGGSISAILLHTPGTSASAATAIDGYELTKQGKAGSALRISTYSSVFGGVVSGIALLALTPPLSKVSLLFGPSDYFLLAVFGLTMIAGVASDSLLKGLISGFLGLLLATFGTDLSSGFPRFTFGITGLISGVSFVPAMIGLFSLSQVMIMVETAKEQGKFETRKVLDWRWVPTLSEVKKVWIAVIRSSGIGVLIGILPGAGGDIASWVSYNEAKRFSKNKKEFGKGSIEGVAASESANNAVTGGSLIPLLTLGIPGSGTAAVLLGALMIKGLMPGRELFTKYADVTYTVMVGFLVANILMGVFGMIIARYATNITRIPNRVLAPIVTALCVLGSFSMGNSMFDVWVMIVFGLIGYIMRKYQFHPAPVVLGLILGPMAEKGFGQSVVLAHGNLAGYYFSRPISVILIILIAGAIFSPFIAKLFRRNRVTET
ncbi:tripartite tricarboxylate transporter permease [Desulfosporosinus sp. BICA1-9]|uniref:tripartite tricarboxylate transporter permease n=1 Tax=Desulfosporosinus sp. BICA1-9 TaxID=1531958 RepID=UPI0005F1AFCB|nr:tripartite tricarboxylate transporter permease [Desulfosporosinus sp. BICA1-9]KJS47418.1 MAG: hypothetical protein VR66_19800 [Peptococcaceae bacterium BRH_c23]KJS88333.1 MAG: hypothetical protein JL57_12135 [Desulfosporosinus sp. BICA1-9]HBW38033.1 hypothetical protein [Desulfosporosinus sp.]